MYALLAAYPVVFPGIHGMNLGVGSLPFIALILGEFLGGAFTLLGQGSYNKKLAANNDMPVSEWRLPPAIVGGIAFTVGLFWSDSPCLWSCEMKLTSIPGSAGPASPATFTGWRPPRRA